MSEKAIPQRKRHAMGDKVNKYAKGGMVTPRVPPYADGVVANSERPKLDSRAGVRHGADMEVKDTVKPLTKKAAIDKGTVGSKK
jgi:hypothetical protein